MWCWKRLLRVPWTARRSNQSILKEISPEYSLEGLMLKLKLQYFGPLMRRTDSFENPWCWERLKAEEGDDRGWDGWMVSPTQWTWVWVNSGSRWWTGRPGMLQSMGSQRVRHDWATEVNWILTFSHSAFFLKWVLSHWLYFSFIFAWYINFKVSLSAFKISSVSLVFQQSYYMSRFGFVLMLFGDSWAYWICDLLSFINFGNYLAIILRYVCCFSISFTNYMYIIDSCCP